MVSYLIKCIVCSGILLAVYHMLLEREKMFRFNRFYLLGAMVISLLMPLVSIEMPPQIGEEAVGDFAAIEPTLSHAAAAGTPLTIPAKESASLPAYLPWLLYALVAAALLLRMGFQIRAMLQSTSGRRIVAFEHAKLVLTPGDTPTYSFFKYIFISQKAFENQSIPKEILTHELSHAKQMHSLDILFTEILIAIWWFNPLLLLYRRAIRLNHEYLADEAVLDGSTAVREYQLLLLDTLIAHRTATLASSFNYPFTKKRLAMMTTRINPRIQFTKKAFVALLLPVLALAFAQKTYSQQPVAKTGPKQEKKIGDTPVSGNGPVSESEMKQFYATIEEHTRYVKNGKGRTDPIVEMSPELDNQLYAMYERMTDAQKADVKAKEIMVFRMDVPVKQAPTPEMFENWKRPEVFGIWLNDKHVPNSELNKYKHSDIAEYSLSKLYGAALKGRSYKYQLNIMTNDYFDKTFEERVNNRVLIVRRGWFNPKEAPKKGK
jgi:bla regulator protein BlaR1